MCALLAHGLRSLYYFRGSLKLGAFVYAITSIVTELVPIAFFLIVIVSSFSIAIWTMLLAYRKEEDSYAKPLGYILSLFNQGLRFPAYFPFSPATTLPTELGEFGSDDGGDDDFHAHLSWQVLLLCEVYVALMQLIILNMLLAVVAQANGRVSQRSQQVARFERTRLVLATEQMTINFTAKGDNRGPHSRQSHASGSVRSLFWWFLDQHTERKKLERVCPPWLHVLLPPLKQEEEEIHTTARGSAAKGLSDLRKLNEIRSKIASQRPVKLARVPVVSDDVKSGEQ